MSYQSKRIQQEKRNKKITLVLLLLVIIALLATIAIFFNNSKYSKISQFTVTGLKNTENPNEFVELMKLQAEHGLLAKILSLDNYFAWGERTHYKNPQYKEITMQKNFNERTINFFVQLKERYAIWCKVEIESELENCRWIDNEGTAFESAPKSSGQLIPSIGENVKMAEFSANAQIMSSSKFNYIKNILDTLRELGIQRESVLLMRQLQELHIQSTSGTKIVFSLRFDPSETALPAIAEFDSDPGLNFFSEINLAVEGRAFTTAR
ncbi:MAG: hypothetical protein Q8Q32_01535 [bacterium]|nr:hypothetical protein [bacterium]